MKKILLSLVLLLLLISCQTSPDDYHIYGNHQVDGYDIYELDDNGLFCNTYYEDIYYSGETYNFGFSYYGCNPAMRFFIKMGEEFIYLHQALDQGIISLDSLMPELEQLERHPEEFASDEADYYWLDFHINSDVVYAYAGGECDQYFTEIFNLNGHTYTYSASGCMKDHILFMEEQGEYVPIADLLTEGKIDADLLIPLLTED